MKNLFGFAVLGCAVVAYLFPGAFTEWFGVKLTSLVVPAIQLIMFGMGTTLGAADFIRVVRRPWAVATAVTLQFVFMPLIGFALAKMFALDAELAAGFILVGSVAGGTASNVIAFLAKADVALSVAMTCCSTLLSPLATPLLMKLLAGRLVEVDASSLMAGVVQIVVAPVAAGAAVHALLKAQFAAHKRALDAILSAFSMAGICFTILAIVASGSETIRTAGCAVAAAAILHNLSGYALGYWTARLLGRWSSLDELDARTIAIEVGMQNSGMASALALGVMDSARIALPANVFSVWMNFSGSILADIFSKHAPQAACKQTAGAPQTPS